MNIYVRRFRRFIRHNRFVVAIAGAIGIAMVMVVISVAIYVRDGVILLDLSRPGYAPVRERIKKNDTTPAFSSTGEINSDVINDFRSQLESQTTALEQLGGFDAAAIDDAALQLKP